MKVRGSMKEVPEIEVNVDTVYLRTNITRIETDDFTGWEYDETQYTKDEYISYIRKIENENEEMKTVLDTMLGVE